MAYSIDEKELGEGQNTGDSFVHEDVADRAKEVRDWEDNTISSRDNAFLDHDYYDGRQWTPEQARKLEARGQAVVVFNHVAPKINYILGVEVDSRKKPRTFPRGVDDEADSQAMTDALRYVSDDDDFEGKFTEGAESCLKTGLGAMVTRTDSLYLKDAKKIISEAVPFDRIFYDPRSRKPDGSDASFMGIITWRPIAEVLQDFPDAGEAIEDSSPGQTVSEETNDTRYRWFNPTTKEIQVVEHYYLEMSDRTKMMEWHECWWVAGGYLLKPRESEYVDDTPEKRTWCAMTLCSPYVAGGTSETPERYGPIRNMRGPQDEINHRRSKAIHLLSTRELYYEQGALVNPDATKAELLKADPMIELTKGALERKRIHVERNTDLAASHVQMLQEAKEEIDAIGPRPIPMKDGGQKMSGRLYIAQQESGSMSMRPVFDQLRRWAISIFKRYLWLIRLTWNEENWYIVRDEDVEDQYRLVGFNVKMTRGDRLQDSLEDGMELKKAIRFAFGFKARNLFRESMRAAQAEAQQQQQQAQMQAQAQGRPPAPPQPIPPEQIQQRAVQLLLELPEAKEDTVINDVGRVNVNLIVETSPNSVLAQHEEFQEMMGLAKDGILPVSNPDILKAMLELSSLPNKRKVIAMLDKPPDPAQQQAAQQAQQMQQAQMQKQIELLSAQVAKMAADTEKSKAQAALAQVKAQTEPLGTQAQVQTAQVEGQATQAETQKTIAEISLTQAQTQKTEAEALKTAHEAGQASVPSSGE